MPKDNSRARLWTLAHAERAALADDLATLTDDQWAHQTLCGRWTVEEVVAHLTAAASTGRFRWIASVLSARFDFDKHNDRRLAETAVPHRLKPSRASGRSFPAPPPPPGTPPPGSAKSSCTPRTSGNHSA